MQTWTDTPEKAKQRIGALLHASRLPYVRDVVIPDEVGGYTQIDHLLLTPHGIILIEWQSQSGVLHGSEHSQIWTRFVGKERHDFPNPLRRVHKLADTLKQITLGDSLGVPLRSYLVLSGASRFAKGCPPSVFDESRLRDWLSTQNAAIPTRYQAVWRVLMSRVACEPVNP